MLNGFILPAGISADRVSLARAATFAVVRPRGVYSPTMSEKLGAWLLSAVCMCVCVVVVLVSRACLCVLPLSRRWVAWQGPGQGGYGRSCPAQRQPTPRLITLACLSLSRRCLLGNNTPQTKERDPSPLWQTRRMRLEMMMRRTVLPLRPRLQRRRQRAPARRAHTRTTLARQSACCAAHN